MRRPAAENRVVVVAMVSIHSVSEYLLCIQPGRPESSQAAENAKRMSPDRAAGKPMGRAVTSQNSNPKTPRVVIVGAGFGGLYAARALRHAGVQVILIDRRNHHTFQPLLYQVATAGLSPGDIATPIRWIFRGSQNVEVLLAEVTDFDLARKVVKAGDLKSRTTTCWWLREPVMRTSAMTIG